MANRYGTQLEALRSKTQSPSWVNGRDVKSFASVISIPTGDAVNDVYRFVSIPVNRRLISLRVSNTAMAALRVRFGVYAKGPAGAAIDNDLFGANLNLANAGANVERLTGGAIGVDDLEKRLQDILGVTIDQHIEVVLGMSVVAAATAAGHIALRGEYA